MTQDVQDAVHILNTAIEQMCRDQRQLGVRYFDEITFLSHAIRHLAYPDRDVYPKTRRGTKGAPVVRR